MIKKMDSEFLNGQIKINIKEDGKMINLMAKEF